LVDAIRLKQPVSDDKPPLFSTAIVVAYNAAEQAFFDSVRLKQPIITIADITPAEPIRLAGERWFEPLRLKAAVNDDRPPLFQPAAPVPYNIVEQAFFDAVALKWPSEFVPGPFAQTSPAISALYLTQPFFDPLRLKQPVVDKPYDVAPPQVVVAVSVAPVAWFEIIKLGKVPERLQEAFGVPFPPGQSLAAWFDAVARLKAPERLQEAFGVPFLPPVLKTASFFDNARLLRHIDRLQEGFGVPLRPTSGPSLVNWFDQNGKIKPALDFPFTATGAVQPNTVRFAITDWYPQNKLRLPILDASSGGAIVGHVLFVPSTRIAYALLESRTSVASVTQRTAAAPIEGRTVTSPTESRVATAPNDNRTATAPIDNRTAVTE
jgi:hypothetical protein